MPRALRQVVAGGEVEIPPLLARELDISHGSDVAYAIKVEKRLKQLKRKQCACSW